MSEHPSEPRTLRTHPELKSHDSFPRFKSLGEAPKNLLEKLLSYFADVRAGEGITVVLLLLNIFLLIYSYSMLKPVRDALILHEKGAAVRSYSAAAQAALLILIIPFYGWLASHVHRMRLIGISTVFFVGNLGLFAWLGYRGIPIAIPFYIWLGIVNYFIVAQFWAFANDVYTEGQGRRLFPMIGVGMSAGALVGVLTTAFYAEQSSNAPFNLMLAGAAVLTVALFLTWAAHQRERKLAPPAVAKEAVSPLGEDGGFRLILEDRYLFWIAVLIVLLNAVNTGGQYLLGSFFREQVAGITDSLAHRSALLRLESGFQTGVNLLGLVLQALFVSRVIRHAGVRRSLFLLPLISLASYSIMLAAPVFVVVRLLKTLENSVDYSLMNTLRAALWLPTSREAKYKAKTAVDTFCVRVGDLLWAAILWIGAPGQLGFGTRGYAAVCVGITLLWFWVAARISREHRRLTV